MDKFTHCVKCGAEKIAALECPSCGAIYAKAERLYKEPPPKVQPCPACGKTVSVNAEACPHCGDPCATSDDDQIQDEPKKRENYPAIVFAILLCIAVIAAISSNDDSKINQQLTDKRQEKSIDALPGIANIQCKHLVTSVIKAPATAKFPISSPANDVGNKTFYVASYVDSQNSFGALLRSNWSCKIHFKGGDPFEAGSWELLDLHVD